YSDSAARAKRQEQRRLEEEQKVRELQEEATRQATTKRRPTQRPRQLSGDGHSIFQQTARPGRV
ncbi:hypothetical protein Pmar_PMAR013114, partial [Perkinsus marinus ATCC 50983]